MSDEELEESGGGGRHGIPIEPLRLWHAFRQRWHWVAVAVVIGAFGGALVAKKFIHPVFSSNAVLEWQPRARGMEAERQTVIGEIRLRSTLEKVKDQLKLKVPVRLLFNSIKVNSNRGSNLIVIRGEWGDGQGVADLVNTVIDVFLDNRRSVVIAKVDAELERLQSDFDDASKVQRDAAAAYDRFRDENGVSDVGTEAQLAIEQVASLRAEADVARAQADAARKELARMGGGGKEKPTKTLTALERTAAKRDRARLLQAREELQKAKIQYADAHPAVRRLEAEVDDLEKRVAASGLGSGGSGRAGSIRRTQEEAEVRQRNAEELAAKAEERLSQLSSVQAKAAVLLGEMRAAEATLERLREQLGAVKLRKGDPPVEFRVVERAEVPPYPVSSSRKKVAIGIPLAVGLLAFLVVMIRGLWGLRILTPSEAAFWSNLPVVGASTWPRDPDMLSSLMHDLDDYAPGADGVTLIIGVSLDEAHLARRVAEWDGHRTSVSDPQKLLSAGGAPTSDAPLAHRNADAAGATGPNMQTLTLTGPVPAQALRRAARLADRVLVVATADKHNVLALTKIPGRLGREDGIGVLLVGLLPDYAMVKDRVGELDKFWKATKATA